MTTTLPTAQQTLADAARALAAKGWRIFPLHSVRTRPDDDGRLVCTCGDSECDQPGKHSALQNKRIQDNVSTDAATVRRWWSAKDLKGNPASPRNIAAATGRNGDAGVIVIDVDAGGAAALAALEVRFGALPATLEARTGTGGRHLFFRYPDVGAFASSSTRLGERIGVIADDGYVVLPPSLHASGMPYAWTSDLPPADLPAWVIARLSPDPTIPTDAPATATPEDPGPALDAYAVFRGTVTGDDVRPALDAAAEAMALAQVDHDSIVKVVVKANEHRCHPSLPRADAEDIAYRAIAEDHARRLAAGSGSGEKAVIDKSKALDQRKLAEMRRRKRQEAGVDPALTALDSWVSAHWIVLDYDDPRGELRLVWLDTGQVVEIPAVAPVADVQSRVLRFVGNLESWARRAHEKATAKQLVRVLQDRAPKASIRKREDADSAPIQLVNAILDLDFWVHEKDERGESKAHRVTLRTREGLFVDAGLGRIRSRGRHLLVVNLPKLAGGALRSHSEFRNLAHRHLLDLLRKAPGFLPAEVRPGQSLATSDVRYRAVDLEEFSSVVDANSVAATPIEIDPPVRQYGQNLPFPSGETAESEPYRPPPDRRQYRQSGTESDGGAP